MTKRLDLQAVLASGNCSGCGACVLTGLASGMALDPAGHLRPVPAASPAGEGPPLADYCPAIAVQRPDPAPGATRDAYFGDALHVWVGHAADPELRFKGSSGGALSALARAALELDEVSGVVVAGGAERGSRTLTAAVTDPAELGEYASSRYAPASTTAALAGAGPGTAIVCRPCEASALRRLPAVGTPYILSFFCAGVPSQAATDDLIEQMGGQPGSVVGLRYRGNGWPGFFSFTDPGGSSHATTYEESWGQHLGKRLQSRCKICVDGVGESADVAAGDIWESDEKGFPVFDEAPGQSVIIARTPRGRALVEHAVARGHLVVADQSISALHAVQPLQVSRRRFLAARLTGRRLAGRSVPKYRGFGLASLALGEPREALRQLRGSYRRAKKEAS